MSESITLTNTANAAAQNLGVLDSGEGLSNQQLLDAKLAANQLLANWTVEQVRVLNAIVATFNLAGGTYTPATTLQFADLTTAISVPDGYGRALTLGLAVELAPQFDIQPSGALLKNLAEARAAASPLIARLGVMAVPFGTAIAGQGQGQG
jgi:hypothetical protein